MTLWIPLWLFEFLLLFNLHDSSYSMCIHWISTLQYILSTIYVIHNSDVAYNHWWFYMAWHCWHGLLDDVEILSHCFFWVLDVLFRMFLSSPLHGLVIINIQWSQVLDNGRKLVSLRFLLIDQPISSVARVYLSILSSLFSFFTIFPWHHRVCVPTIHSWWDDIF